MISRLVSSSWRASNGSNVNERMISRLESSSWRVSNDNVVTNVSNGRNDLKKIFNTFWIENKVLVYHDLEMNI